MRSLLVAVALSVELIVGAAHAEPAEGAAQEPDSASAQQVIAPKALETPAAPYPEGASGEAAVVLELEIAEDGTVTRVTVREGDAPFADAARLAAERWRFEPATRGGIPVRVRVLSRVLFHDPGPRPDAAGAANASEAAPDAPAMGDSDEHSPKPKPSTPVTTGSGSDSQDVIDLTVVGKEREELGSIHIPKHEARLIPGAFADPFRVVEVLPGVAPILSGLPYFFVRGAPPGDVGYYLDGIRVPILFHVGAGPSVIAPALVDRVDLYPSAYPARFGRSVGGIMAGETQAPSNVARGEAQARVFDAAAMIEQPFAAGAGSVLLGGRYSYTQALLSLVAPDYELGYGDYQARLAYAVSTRDRLSLFAFGSFDQVRNREIDKTLFDVSFHRLDLRWDRSSASDSVRVAATLASDRVLNAQEDVADPGSRITSDGARLRIESDHLISPELRLRGGADFGADRIGVERESQNDIAVAFPARTDFSAGAFADAVLRPARRVEIVPGVRVDVARSREQDQFFAEPRLATRLQLAYGVAWISAFGVAHQLPTNSVHVAGDDTNPFEASRQEAWQASEGVEFVLPESMLGRVTLFHSWIDAEEADASARNYGLELFLRRNFTERLGGFLSYTLSRAERDYDWGTVAAPFDRRQVATVVLGYDLGKGFRAGTRAYFASGRPYFIACPTPDCGPGDPTAFAPYLRSGRLPNFFRLDLRFEKRWHFASGAWIAGTFEWFNALLAEETTDRYWDAARGGIVDETRSPLTLPSIGVEAGY
ncbi:MAG TPA: TonB family protein [Polyangiaceae bacterium]|jgi:TonB family protein|nr:TonB family protein [Polyangiaceae bacterium]